MKTRQLTSSYYSPKMTFKEYQLDEWDFAFPVPNVLGEPDIKDTYHFYSWRGHCHYGIDILGKWNGSVPFKQPVVSCGSGVVIDIGYNEVYGNNVTIRHGKNRGYWLYTRYAHLHTLSPLYKKGSLINKNSFIGYVGNTGDSDSPHLHLEFKMHGWMLPYNMAIRVDPITLLPRDEVINRLWNGDSEHGISHENLGG